jgi:S-layer protein
MTATQAQQLYVAYFNRPADTLGLAYWTGKPAATASAAFASSAEYANTYAGMSTAARVDAIYTNLFGRSAEPAGLTYWGGLIESGQVTVSNAVTQIAAGAQGTDLVAYNSKVTAATAFTAGLVTTAQIVGYSGTTANNAAKAWMNGITDAATATAATVATVLNASIATVVAAATTTTATASAITLTIGADTGASFTGTSGDNTFDASGFFNAPTATFIQTLGNGDSINGGLGTDTLNVALNTATATTRAAALTSIEVINLTNTVGTNILDLAGATGVTTLNSVNSATQIAQFDNVQSAPTNFGLTNTGVGLTANILNAALAGTTNAATLTLNGVTAGTVTLQTLTAASGYETLNIVSSGSTANVLTAVTDGISTSLATINVSGTQAVNLGATLDATVLTVDASTLTGILTVTQTNAVKTTITGGSANDVIDVSGAFVDLTDTTNADVINGGAGTDVLRLAYAEGAAVTSAAQWANVTSIETVRFDTVAATTAINGAFFTGVTTFEFDGGIGALSHIVASGQEIQYDTADADDNAQSFTITGVATTDSMIIDINGVDIGAGTQTYVGIETLNIATSDTALMDGAHVMTATAATETINISGTGTLTLGNITADAINVTMTAGTLNLGTMQQATVFNGGASVDTITGSVAGDILIGGAGADFLTNTAAGAAASAGDIMTGGADFDTFTLVGVSASTTNYTGSATITDFTVGASATNTDFLRLSANDASYAATGLTVDGTGAGAAGSVGVLALAQNGTAAGVNATTEFVKLTTGVAFDTNLQTTFNAAIGTGSVTGLTDGFYAASFYDTTNSLMVIVAANTATAGAGALDTGDAVTLIGTVSMTAADYAVFNTHNFADFV